MRVHTNEREKDMRERNMTYARDTDRRRIRRPCIIVIVL